MDRECGERYRLFDIILANLSWNIYDGHDVGGIFALPYSTLELATHSVQYLACYLLEMAQVLGSALRRSIGNMVYSNVIGALYDSGYATYYIYISICSGTIQTIKYFLALVIKV